VKLEKRAASAGEIDRTAEAFVYEERYG